MNTASHHPSHADHRGGRLHGQRDGSVHARPGRSGRAQHQRPRVRFLSHSRTAALLVPAAPIQVPAPSFFGAVSFIGKTYTTYGGTTFTTYPTVASFVNGTKDPLYRTAICLTCHDGSASVTGMHGTTVETVDGGSAHAPTYLATDVEGLTNDHPVHIPYVPAAAPGGKHWAGTVDANGKVWWTNDPAQAAFVAAYGHAGSLYGAAAGGTTVGNGTPSTAAGAYVECTSCHDHHSMTKRRQSIGQVWTPTANCTTGGATDPYCGSYAGGTSCILPHAYVRERLV